MTKKPMKFSGDLAKPIFVPLTPLVHLAHPETTDAKKFRAKLNNEISKQRLEKMTLLARRYGLDEKNPLCWYFVTLFLAIEAIPGFQVSVGRTGSAGAPKKEDPKLLLATIDLLKNSGLARTDLQAAEIWAIAQNENLKSAGRKSERVKQARTIANSVSSARASAHRKRSGKVQ